MPTFDQLLKFSRGRCLILENMQPESSSVIGVISQTHAISDAEQLQTGKRYSQTFIGTGLSCPVCKAEHNIQACKEFLKLSSCNRNQIVRGASFCYNCLRTNHLAKECKSGDCKKCHRRHNTLLHPDEATTEKSENIEKPTTNLQSFVHSQVLLSTALVNFRNQGGGIYVKSSSITAHSIIS